MFNCKIHTWTGNIEINSSLLRISNACVFSETLLFTWARFQKIIPPLARRLAVPLPGRVRWEEAAGEPAASARGCQDACGRPQSGLVQSETRAAPLPLALLSSSPSPSARRGGCVEALRRERLCFTHLRTERWTRTCHWNYQPTLPNHSVACFACYHRGGVRENRF